jgi:hypothetical protein
MRPKRKNFQTARRRILRADEKTKVTLTMRVGTSTLLSVQAKMRGTDRSVEAERLILAGLADIAIMRNGQDYAAGIPPDDGRG